MLLVVLLGMAGFGIDVGAWYARGSQIQRAADAAALAGVVWMPGNFPQARAVALDVAKRNGFDPATNSNITINVQPDPGSPHRLDVDIRDSSVPRYFSKVFLSNVTEKRAAVAEYDLPVPLGSPENSFGTGTIDLGGGVKSQIWASVNGFCTSQEDGDLRLSRYDGIRPSGGYSCPYPSAPTSPAILSPDYDSTGYFYDVEMPAFASNTNIDVYDPAFEGSAGCGSPDLNLASGAAITTLYRIYYSPLPLDHNSDVLKAGPIQYNSGDSASCNKWNTLYTLRPGIDPAGLYRLEVYTLANESNKSIGSNQFGIRAGAASGWTRCSTITAPTTCPAVHGENDISVFASQSGASAVFYLCQVDAIYAGKEMDIQLFDPGEGAQSIEILDPSGNPVSFTWATTDSKSGFTSFSGSGSSLDVSGTITPPPGYSSTSKFSDRHVLLKTTIPSSYGSGGLVNGGWWKIRYKTGSGTVTDRTTWSVAIIGDPVHLVN